MEGKIEELIAGAPEEIRGELRVWIDQARAGRSDELKLVLPTKASKMWEQFDLAAKAVERDIQR
ncbi:MAG: hypothetical protein AAB403_22750 [Planctomycetota bacterium]